MIINKKFYNRFKNIQPSNNKIILPFPKTVSFVNNLIVRGFKVRNLEGELSSS